MFIVDHLKDESLYWDYFAQYFKTCASLAAFVRNLNQSGHFLRLIATRGVFKCSHHNCRSSIRVGITKLNAEWSHCHVDWFNLFCLRKIFLVHTRGCLRGYRSPPPNSSLPKRVYPKLKTLSFTASNAFKRPWSEPDCKPNSSFDTGRYVMVWARTKHQV